jgi:hypothetical protein
MSQLTLGKYQTCKAQGKLRAISYYSSSVSSA